MTEQDDSAFVGVPANSLPDGAITDPPAEDSYLGSEGPQAVVDRARRLAVKTRRDNANDVDRLERRIRWIYLAIVVFVIVVLTPTTQSIEHSYHTCLDQRNAAITYNGYLDVQVQNAIKSTLLTNAQKAERVAQGNRFHTFVPRHCSGIWPFQP